MELESITNKSTLRGGTLCIETKSWEDNIEFYGLEGKGAKIPYGKTEEFIQNMNRNVNGEEIVSVKINNIDSIKIPKSKLEKINFYLKISEEIGKKCSRYREVF